MSRVVKVLIAAVVALFVVTIFCVGALFVVSGGQPVDFIQTTLIRVRLAGRTADLNRSIGSDPTPVRFTIDPGSTPRLIANDLYTAGLILDPDLFVDYVRANDIDVELEAGTYFLNRAQTLVEIANALTDSRSSQFLFRILEGWRMEEIAEVIDNNPYFGFSGSDFLAVVGANASLDPAFVAYANIPAGASLEGF
ncbi:MAG: endolytic transglycosylase MltG, partial [Phycisphaerales bacterium]|nr:endolytic transglycosylase MltG [Phycisphaerales bacterium]